MSQENVDGQCRRNHRFIHSGQALKRRLTLTAPTKSVTQVGAIDSIAQGSAVIQVPNLGQNLQNRNKINSEHSVHSVKISTADDADLREYDSIKHRGHGARRGPTTNPAAAG